MKKQIAFLLVSILCLSVVSRADIWAEREALSKIESELAALEELVKSAHSLSNPSDRTTFDYQSLINDIRKIRSGISEHLTVPMEPVVPSSINALSTKYTEHE